MPALAADLGRDTPSGAGSRAVCLMTGSLSHPAGPGLARGGSAPGGTGMPAYVIASIVLILAMFACAVIALLRAERDIPAVVDALARWWRR